MVSSFSMSCCCFFILFVVFVNVEAYTYIHTNKQKRQQNRYERFPTSIAHSVVGGLAKRRNYPTGSFIFNIDNQH